MPYIERGRRAANNSLVISTELGRPIAIDNVGELNFAITTLVSEYVRRKGISYAILNDVVGVMTSTLTEFQRRVVAPYEDIKCSQNGDVYNYLLDLMSPYLGKDKDHVEPDKQA